jgi:intracellular sulfur oxidation DsrE/DsrF family protein
MKFVAFGAVAAAVTLALGQPGGPSAKGLAFPRIAGYGGVVEVPGGVDPPRAEAKVLFDVASESLPEGAHRGIEAVARYVNLHAAAGHPPAGLKAVAVLHGGATRAALSDAASAKHLKADRNPSLELIRELRGAGVEVLVCGQSLARNGYEPGEVAPEAGVAVSAMSVVVNRQQDGYAVVTIR